MTIRELAKRVARLIAAIEARTPGGQIHTKQLLKDLGVSEGRLEQAVRYAGSRGWLKILASGLVSGLVVLPTPDGIELAEEADELASGTPPIAPGKCVPTDTDSLPRRVDFVVFTALDKEFRPIRETFGALRIPKFSSDANEYWIASVMTTFGYAYDVALFCVGDKGGEDTSAALTSAIITWKPRHVVMAGIAATPPGESREMDHILVANYIVDLSEFKVLPDQAIVRQRQYQCDGELVRAVVSMIGDGPSWAARCHVGVVVSQKDLVKNAKYRDTLCDYVDAAIGSRPIGIEMEGRGVGAAVSRQPADGKPGMLLVKGAVDYANYWKHDEYQQSAALATARFLLDFLCRGPISASQAQLTKPTASTPPIEMPEIRFSDHCVVDDQHLKALFTGSVNLKALRIIWHPKITCALRMLEVLALDFDNRATQMPFFVRVPRAEGYRLLGTMKSFFLERFSQLMLTCRMTEDQLARMLSAFSDKAPPNLTDAIRTFAALAALRVIRQIEYLSPILFIEPDLQILSFLPDLVTVRTSLLLRALPFRCHNGDIAFGIDEFLKAEVGPVIEDRTTIMMPAREAVRCHDYIGTPGDEDRLPDEILMRWVVPQWYLFGHVGQPTNAWRVWVLRDETCCERYMPRSPKPWTQHDDFDRREDVNEQLVRQEKIEHVDLLPGWAVAAMRIDTD